MSDPKVLCRQVLLVHGSFPYSLHLHVWFDIPPFISTEQAITHHQFVIELFGLWQLHYSVFAIFDLRKVKTNNYLCYIFLHFF